jgi:hypothetical protein
VENLASCQSNVLGDGHHHFVRHMVPALVANRMNGGCHFLFCLLRTEAFVESARRTRISSWTAGALFRSIFGKCPSMPFLEENLHPSLSQTVQFVILEREVAKMLSTTKTPY